MDERRLKKKKERAIQEKNYEQIYNYCKDLADIYLHEENNELALQEYQEAEKAAKKLNHRMYIAIANRMIGETLCAMGEFEAAIKHQKIHLTYSREEKDLVEEQRALATLGRTYFVQAESINSANDSEKNECLKLCRKCYVKSLNICEKLSSTTQLSTKTLSEMKLRLFLNLGLSLESEGDTNAGIEYISKAINICKSLESWEDLVRCYSAQGSLYFRQGDTARALSRYDEALKIAERLEQKTQLSCDLLSLKADVLIALSDFNSAKNVLINACKMKTPDVKERQEIEKKLKIVYLICRAESELLQTSENDCSYRRKLCENIGDYCVKLKNFDNAITHYRKTLEYSVAMGLQGKELGPIYYSLSQTYKDNGQYKLALEYSLKEFELSKDNPAEGCKSLLNVIELMELQNESFEKLMEQYNKALSMAKRINDFKLESTVLRYIKCTQLEHNRADLAEQTQQELDVIEACLSTQESGEDAESVDEEETLEDVDLVEILNLESDEEQDEAGREKHTRRRITKSTLTRRNEKGETPLHVASAKGNIQLIKSLIQQGHPVNIPDAAGWSPLHEACNHGQVEAARILIENGAQIDDRGGPCCDGITPLLDAASNGHLDLITLLLDKGASPLARTNQGDTALDCLLACRERALIEGEILDSVTQSYFNDVVERLRNCLNKVGQPTRMSNLSSHDNRRERSQISQSQTRSEKFSQALDRSRKRTEADFSKESPVNATHEYRTAIDALRHGSKTKITEPLTSVEKIKKNALLTTDDIGDDWLEDDLSEQHLRPTKRRCEQFVGQQLRNMNKASSPAIPKASTSATPAWNDFLEDIDFDDNTSPPPSSSHSNAENEDDSSTFAREELVSLQLAHQNERPKPKYQKSLMSVGFTRFNPPSHSTQELPHETFLEPTHRSKRPIPSTVTKSIKVRVEEKLFLVPVPPDSEQLTVGWLVSEASRRYQNLEGVAPVLNLMTADGALLDTNDPLSIVLNESEICASVVSWNLAPLVDRYKEACAASNSTVDSHLERQLDMCQASGCLEIEDCHLTIALLKPMLKAISHHQNLQNISLSSCFLNDQNFQILIDYISKLNGIRSLDVSVNCITNDGLSYFSRIVSSGSLQTMEELNVSCNPLGEESIASLIHITSNLMYLRSLNLRYVGFTAMSFHGASNFILENLESLDLSHNELGREGAAKFFSTLNLHKIRSLSLSSSGGSEVFRECLLFLDRGHLDNLRALYLSDMDIDDGDIEQLVPCLSSANELNKLDLSNNSKITVAVHNLLSSLKQLRELDLSGCDLLTVKHELNLPLCRLSLSSTCSENEFYESPYNYVTNRNDIVF